MTGRSAGRGALTHYQKTGRQLARSTKTTYR